MSFVRESSPRYIPHYRRNRDSFPYYHQFQGIFPSNTGKMPRLFSPAALLLYTCAPYTHAAAFIMFLRLKTSTLKLFQVPVCIALLHLALPLPSYIKVSHHISTASTRNKRVYRETVTWHYSAQTQRALHQLLQQCQGDSQC